LISPMGKGVERFQYEFLNRHLVLTPDIAATYAQRAVDSGFDPDNQDIWKDDNFWNEIRGAKTEDLIKGPEFEDKSYWLTDPKTGEIEAGHLPDGKPLVLGPEGGQNGIFNDYIAHQNPNLSPQEVGNIASNTVSENNLKPPQEVEGEVTFDKIVGEELRPQVIETINQRIAQLSLREYFEDKFGLGKNQAYQAIRQIEFVPLGRETVLNAAIGTEALDKLNARVNIPDKGIFAWNWTGWNDWLKEKGVLN